MSDLEKHFDKSLILLRGLPGSGKSTLAKLLSEEGKYPFYSVDDYFTNKVTGEYHFVFSENHLAYKLCEQNTLRSMEDGKQKIILHNTFTLDWELAPYFKLAKQFYYQLFVATIENYHEQLNVHGVSNEQLKKMAEKYKVKLF